MKACRTCGEVKPLTEFYKHSSCPDGHKAHCKRCVARKQAEKNAAHPEIRRATRARTYEQRAAYSRKYGQTEARKASARKTRSRPEYRKRAAASLREYRKLNKLKTWARNQVTHAKQQGWIVALPCEQCGAQKAEAHHDDYTKPLDVRWLCRLCHMRHHDHGFQREPRIPRETIPTLMRTQAE